jgi:hypothetical protein
MENHGHGMAVVSACQTNLARQAGFMCLIINRIRIHGFDRKVLETAVVSGVQPELGCAKPNH